MKIKSVTDVITNSSTEVFAMTSQLSVEKLKKMINLLLEVSGSTKTCDDLFDIHLEVSQWMDEDVYMNIEGEDPEKSWEDLTDQEKLDWCLEHADYDWTSLYPEIKVTPKSSDIPQELINLLEATVDCGLTPVDATFG